MTCNEFKRWLAKLGCAFDASSGKGGHIKVTFKGKQTWMPMHGSREIKKGTTLGILKQFGIKERP